jgi:hypothetical protein
MPKSPAVLLIYQGLTQAGQVASVLAALLGLACLGWMAWQARTRYRGLLSLALIQIAILSLVFLFAPPAGWLSVCYQLLILGSMISLGWTAFKEGENRLAVLPPALALSAGVLHSLIPAVFTTLRQPGPPPFTTAIFNLGELLVVLSGIGFWWALKPKSLAAYLLALLPVVAFTAMHQANSSMAGILTIWSIGLTLYLPWPLYAISLWLGGAAAISALRQGQPAGWAILLLAAGGYAPQLSGQVFFGLAAIYLLGINKNRPAEEPLSDANVQVINPLFLDPSSPGHPRPGGA